MDTAQEAALAEDGDESENDSVGFRRSMLKEYQARKMPSRRSVMAARERRGHGRSESAKATGVAGMLSKRASVGSSVGGSEDDKKPRRGAPPRAARQQTLQDRLSLVADFEKLRRSGIQSPRGLDMSNDGSSGGMTSGDRFGSATSHKLDLGKLGVAGGSAAAVVSGGQNSPLRHIGSARSLMSSGHVPAAPNSASLVLRRLADGSDAGSVEAAKTLVREHKSRFRFGAGQTGGILESVHGDDTVFSDSTGGGESPAQGAASRGATSPLRA